MLFLLTCKRRQICKIEPMRAIMLEICLEQLRYQHHQWLLAHSSSFCPDLSSSFLPQLVLFKIERVRSHYTYRRRRYKLRVLCKLTIALWIVFQNSSQRRKELKRIQGQKYLLHKWMHFYVWPSDLFFFDWRIVHWQLPCEIFVQMPNQHWILLEMWCTK